MNRIILIGNGFDLAHGMKTSYQDFINWFWKNKIEKINNRPKVNTHVNQIEYRDEEILVSMNANEIWRQLPEIEDKLTFNELEELLTKYRHTIVLENKFLEYISNKISLQNWIDIEQEYYNQLLGIKDKKSRIRITIKELNSDFEKVKQDLKKYLIKEIETTLYQVDKIKELIYKKIDYKDFTQKGINTLIEEQYANYLKGCEEEDEETLKLYARIQEEINEFLIEEEKQYFENNISKINLSQPQNILFLNFNYTDTSSKYIFQCRGNKKKKTIHIHGELNNPQNPIIFGYGDELAEEYHQIEKLNDNEYLKNVKSINYLKTDNYKQLLNFINSDSYQIFILGHSCGNSDRTLLNTLFEHENCVSIKPFFYQKADGTDNYEEIVMNISRNFKDKTAFRAKVVNKTYCKPLPQIQK